MRLDPPILLASLALAAAAPSLARGQIYTRVNGDGVIEATNVPDGPGFRLAYVGKGTLIHSRYFRRAYNGEFDSHIYSAAAANGLSTELVKAVIAVESEFDPLAVSSKGAQGLMQLMPFTARRFGVYDSFDARQNIFGGVRYLRFLLDTFHGDVALALAGYNAGENAVARFKGIPPYKETRNYVAKVQRLLGGGFFTRASGAASAQAAYYAPNVLRPVPPPARGARGKITPARPSIYYKWSDETGRVRVATLPPPDGVTYTMIRALD
jgi:hypothetical protein